jgi:hypothetical protein
MGVRERGKKHAAKEKMDIIIERVMLGHEGIRFMSGDDCCVLVILVC